MAFNAFDVAGVFDRFSVYREARHSDPAFCDSKTGAWNFTRYADVEHVLMHPEIFSSSPLHGPPQAQQEAQAYKPVILRADPPDHTRLRRLLNRAFTSSVLARLKPTIDAVVSRSLDAALERGQLDVVADFGSNLSLTVISEMMGIPENARGSLRRWAYVITQNAVDTAFGKPMTANVEGIQARKELAAFFDEILEQRRVKPENDIISDLLRAEEGESLTATEVASTCRLLLGAGNVTTAAAISNATLALTQHPDQLKKVQADPQANVPAFLEEALRWFSPTQVCIRYTREATHLAGLDIPKNATVAAWLGSANRDEAVFPDAEKFDVTRKPNPHMAFGKGPHFCMGAQLSRLESRVALEQLLTRVPDFWREPGPPQMSPSFLVFEQSSLIVKTRPPQGVA